MGIYPSPWWLCKCDKVREKIAQPTAKTLGWLTGLPSKIWWMPIIQLMVLILTQHPSLPDRPGTYRDNRQTDSSIHLSVWAVPDSAAHQLSKRSDVFKSAPASSSQPHKIPVLPLSASCKASLCSKYHWVLNLPGSVPKEHTAVQVHLPHIDFIFY